jgi:hypothetical protein
MSDTRPTRSAAPGAIAGLAFVTRIKQGRACTPRHPAWAPPGYDETDIGGLEWIASHRRGATGRTRPTRLAG